MRKLITNNLKCVLRAIFVLSLTIHFCYSSSLIAPLEVPEPGSAEWFAFCEGMKKEALLYQEMSINYSNTIIANSNEENISSSYFKINLNGISVPFPTLEYQEYKIYKDKFGFELRLKADSGFVIAISSEPASRYVDAFGYDYFVPPSLGPNEYSSEENLLLTKKYFNGPVTQTEIIMHSLNVTPLELKCKRETIERDRYLLVLMEHKSIAPLFKDHKELLARVFPLDYKGMKGFISVGYLGSPILERWAVNFIFNDYESKWSAYIPFDVTDEIGVIGLAFLEIGKLSNKPTWAVKLEDLFKDVIDREGDHKIVGLIGDL